MSNVEKISKIKSEALSQENYFQTLLEQGYMAHLLSDSELEKIQIDSLALLAKKTEQYNNGDSSSIRMEKAQDLLSSILFTIGVQLKNYATADDAITAIQTDGTEAIYKEGQKRIDKLVKQSKMRHSALVGRLLETENVFYSSTIVDGIKGFFKLYNPEFAAQEIHITADYPVYNKTNKLLGIEFISHYLEQLYYENLFCTHFSDEDIHNLLCGYDEHYENLLFNLYELVLTTAIGCTIAGIDANRLTITSTAKSFLHRQFVGKEQFEIEQLLVTALSDLSHNLSLTDSLQEYVRQSLPQLSATIENASKAGIIDQIFITSKHIDESPKLIASYGEKMNDELYRKVLDEFMYCDSIAKKRNIIKEHIHSLADWEDILIDSELSEEEILVFLQELTPSELAVLVKKYSSYSDYELSDLRSHEVVLSNCISFHVSALLLQQQAWIKEAAATITIVY